MALMAAACSTSAQAIYEQKTYIFSGLPDGSNIIEDADAQKQCEQGIKFIQDRQIYDINPNYYLRLKIYSVNITQRNSRMQHERGPQVGEMLICQDWNSYAAGVNHVPIYYEVVIGGTRFRIVGGGTSPLFPAEDVLPGGGGTMTSLYPEYGIENLSYTGTVIPSMGGRRGGMFYSGNLGFLDGMPREYYDHSASSVLQVLIPPKQ